MLFFLAVLACIGLGVVIFFNLPRFGALPEGERLERIKRSPNFADGEFRNQVPTPMFAEGVSQVALYREFFFGRKDRQTPAGPLPSVKADLTALTADEDALVWLGHSSFFLQLSGKRILLDPVFSGNAGPVWFAVKAFAGTSPYKLQDMPDVDVVLISHDHWDHLDHDTLLALRDGTAKIVCPLGVGAHLERWGFAPDRIIEADWYEKVEPLAGLAVHVMPARHFSGRGISRNRSLWASFVLESPERRVYYSGDTGYGPHFKDIASRFPGFDLAMLDSGQYDKNWPYLHMTPEEAVQAARELGAGALMPMHVGRFCISNHPWDDPFRRAVKAASGEDFRLLTPPIGEVVRLGDTARPFSRWWEGVQ